MIELFFALFLMAHGLVHLLWFVVPWGLMEVDELPYSTKILAGRIDIGDDGIRIFGLLWAMAAIGFVLAGIGILFSAQWSLMLLVCTVVFSFVLCILYLPVAKYGALINVAIVASYYLCLQFCPGEFYFTMPW